MPPVKKFQSASVSLSPQDKFELAKLAQALGTTKAEVARDAIRWYVENYEQVANKDRNDATTRVILNCTDRIIAVIQKCTDRICSLLVRNVIDTNLNMMLFYRMLPAGDADRIMSGMYRMAVSRVMRKIPKEELRISTMLREGLEQEILDEKLVAPPQNKKAS